MKELLTMVIKGKKYFVDSRLGEYRNVKNPFEVIKFNADERKIWEVGE
jgi:hypothetical protein